MFETCPVCDNEARVVMVADWQERGEAIPIIGCGNPWHYGLGDAGVATPAGESE